MTFCEKFRTWYTFSDAFDDKGQEMVKQKDVAVHFQGLINNFGEVLRYLGIGLLVLGGLSAIALLFLAVLSPERLAKASKTLWSLFFITLVLGLVVLSFAR
jgi:hypothetical protein